MMRETALPAFGALVTFFVAFIATRLAFGPQDTAVQVAVVSLTVGVWLSGYAIGYTAGGKARRS